MSPRLLIVLSIGTVVMLVPIIIQASWYKIKLWKTILIGILLTVAGTSGTYLMYFFENGYFDGVSFYGAVFFVPAVFIPLAWVFHIPYGQLMDLCAPAECVMLAITKTQCLVTGCCGGRILFANSAGLEIRFPSQIAEFLNALILCAVLLFLCKRQKQKGRIYLWYVLLYGITRFVLNFFRDIWVKGAGIPIGTVWSLIAIGVAAVWLILLWRGVKRKVDGEVQK